MFIGLIDSLVLVWLKLIDVFRLTQHYQQKTTVFLLIVAGFLIIYFSFRITNRKDVVESNKTFYYLMIGTGFFATLTAMIPVIIGGDIGLSFPVNRHLLPLSIRHPYQPLALLNFSLKIVR